jgi:AcrR family transcriptional regulator
VSAKDQPPAPGAEEKRSERRERRRENSREEILAAAREVILRSGIGGATLEAVAKEVGMSKPALYYYFPSKDALLFELIFGALQGQATTVHDAVAAAEDGPAALGAIIRESIAGFAPQLDDFRLAFLYSQVASPGAIRFDESQFGRLRPLNGLLLAGAVEKLAEGPAGRAGIEPRLLAFLAYLSSLGVLTMKGLVEGLDDPLVWTDEQLIDGLSRVFAAAATP